MHGDRFPFHRSLLFSSSLNKSSELMHLDFKFRGTQLFPLLCRRVMKTKAGWSKKLFLNLKG